MDRTIITCCTVVKQENTFQLCGSVYEALLVSSLLGTSTVSELLVREMPEAENPDIPAYRQLVIPFEEY